MENLKVVQRKLNGATPKSSKASQVRAQFPGFTVLLSGGTVITGMQARMLFAAFKSEPSLSEPIAIAHFMNFAQQYTEETGKNPIELILLAASIKGVVRNA